MKIFIRIAILAMFLSLVYTPLTNAEGASHTQTVQGVFGPKTYIFPTYTNATNEKAKKTGNIYVPRFDNANGVLTGITVTMASAAEAWYDGSISSPAICGVNANLEAKYKVKTPDGVYLTTNLWFNKTITLYPPNVIVDIDYGLKSKQTGTITMPSSVFSSFIGSGNVKMPLEMEFIQNSYGSSRSVTGYFTAATQTTVSVTYHYEEPFTNLGGGTQGLNGMPELEGAGQTIPGNTITLQLSNAPSNAPLLLLIGGAPNGVPHNGGVLFTIPILINYYMKADSNGDCLLSGPWPPFILGDPVTFQFLVSDSTASNGYSLSNGLLALSR